ncbi:hypothetical protein ANOM_009541 [Aspergillus nomiae NRRL 13137]|uniref:Uncharacterized protein n=1 Tax=Aspergillus nomiae NRRL (strain ATCC 15546 / NRRL 13137 / CBS 260.88 / M93) TaxID=1509407 RepID=A0A0L1IVP6_ASPN3|nr:uncharacterized protein ANOM_009541 [Aspergillus nomiae NRRL 13137]KNG83562.1 hypothetical protein ANOM_009541 [Aspergillus nomiae NRRL 13137]
MARLSIFCLAYFTLTLLSGANAWTLTWRNDTGAQIVDGDSIRNCTRIYHEKGQEFAFNPEGEWCLKFWEEPTCQTQIGKTCEGRRWQQIASRNISAFNVYVMPPADISANGMATSTSSTSSTTTTTSSASTSAVATETTQPGGDEPPSSSLSGGAIAGIVIGAVAGVAILAALFFFWGRRKRNAAAPAPTDTTPAPGPEQPLPEAVDPPKPAMSETQTQVSSVSPYGYPVAGGQTVELPGEKVGAELSNSRQLVEMGSTPLAEMDGTSIVKRP